MITRGDLRHRGAAHFVQTCAAGAPGGGVVDGEDAVVFPGMNITLTAAVGDDERVVLVPRHDGEFADNV